MKLSIYTLALIFFASIQVQAKLNVQGAAQAGISTYVTMVVVNEVLSKEYKAKCTSQNYTACAAAALTAAQALTSGAQAVDTYRTRDESACTGVFCGAGEGGENGTPIGGGGSPGLPNGPIGSPTLGRIIDDARGTLADMQGRGFNINPDGSVNYNGNNISAQDLASGAAAGVLGSSIEDIAEVDAIKKKDLSKDQRINKLLNQIASELEGASGAGKNKARGYVAETDIDYSKLFAGLNGNKGERGLAGLEKKLGNDSIGVAQDNIFHIIKRRYSIKKSELTP